MIIFSLSDSFQALFLSEYYKNGSLPERVLTQDIIGPVEDFEGIEGITQVELGEVLKASSKVSLALDENLPSRIECASHWLNPAEFLIAMVEAFLLS